MTTFERSISETTSWITALEQTQQDLAAALGVGALQFIRAVGAIA